VPNKQQRVVEYTTSLPQRESRHLRDIATSAAQWRLSSRSFGRDAINPNPGVTRTIAVAQVLTPGYNPSLAKHLPATTPFFATVNAELDKRTW
jgi:hypothetical protein